MSGFQKLYINEIEASERYCYSRSWFQRSRWAGTGPQFLKIGSKVLYPLTATDDWFMQHGLRNNTAKVMEG